jgi:hypothetical protein
VELRPIDVRDAGEIERGLAAFAQGSDGGIIVIGTPGAAIQRDLIIALAAKHRLPAVWRQAELAGSAGASQTQVRS